MTENPEPQKPQNRNLPLGTIPLFFGAAAALHTVRGCSTKRQCATINPPKGATESQKIDTLIEQNTCYASALSQVQESTSALVLAVIMLALIRMSSRTEPK